MNNIVTTVAAGPDGQVGFDGFGQLVCWLKRDDGTRVGFTIADVREKTCAICERPWELTPSALANQWHWTLIDDYVHETCLVRYVGLRELETYRSALWRLRMPFEMTPIPNGYFAPGTRWAAKPWYRIELRDPPIELVIGRRKRVHNIEVRPTGSKPLHWYEGARAAFADEDVTKKFGIGRISVHAWTDEKMGEYIDRLVRIGRTAG